MAFDVFLSHAKEDLEFAKKIHDTLERININCFLFELYPYYGELIPDVIRDRISECRYFVVLMTEAGVRSQWVNQEIGIAHALNKLIIPIAVKDVTSEGCIELRQHIDYDGAIYGLVYRLRELFNKMSRIPDELELICSNKDCNKKFSVDLPSNEEVNEAIRRNKVFYETCPHCGSKVLFRPKSLEIIQTP